MAANNLLFIYETLLNVNNEYAAYLKANSSFYTEGKLNARLYNIGEYPGALISKQNGEYVYGSILQIDEPVKVLPVIDDYEGFGEDQPQPNEFIRELLPIQTQNGELNCWVYLYNLPVEGLPQIASGRWLSKS